MKMKNKMIDLKKRSVFYAVLAAALYAVSTPISKILLVKVPPAMMAALLYLGAGIGMTILGLAVKKTERAKTEQHLTRKELPYIICMVALDIAAPIFLMVGLSMTTSASASLLNNFEIVATSLIALLVFKEAVSKRLWLGIGLITASSIILSIKDINSLSFSLGSIFVLLACVCWGLENNCTRKLSGKNPLEIVVVKGYGSGLGSLIIAVVLRESVTDMGYIFAALLLGFAAYGLSIFFYVYAQRELGAAKTSAYYGVAPFIGSALSLIVLREIPALSFFIALVIMMAGAYFASSDAK